MSSSFDDMVVSAYQGKTAQELLQAPPDALKGVSAGDAEHLRNAFGIETVGDLASSPYFAHAQAVLGATGTPPFDPGPSPEWASFFANAPVQHYLTHPTGRFRIDFGPVYYRGRLDGTARVIVVGQDPSVNEILGHRVFVGRSGQRLQGFLRKLGLDRSYIILNTYLFSVFGQFDTELKGIADESEVLSFRNAFLDRLKKDNPVQAVIGVGRGGQHGVETWPGQVGLTSVEITHPAAHDEAALLASWSAALNVLRPIVEADDGMTQDPNPYGTTFTDDDHEPIPRHDLPFGIPDWHGVGSHAKRDGSKKIVWTAP